MRVSINPLTSLPINYTTSYSPMSGTGANGAGFLDFMGKVSKSIGRANQFLKQGRYISGVSGAIARATNSDSLQSFSDAARQYGYGDGRKGVKNAPKKNGRKGGLAKARKARKTKK